MNLERRLSRRTLARELWSMGKKVAPVSLAAVAFLEFGFALWEKDQPRQQKLRKFSDTMQNISVVCGNFYPHFEAPLVEIGDYNNWKFDRGNLLDVIGIDYQLRESAFLAVYRAALPVINTNSAALVKNTVSPAPLTPREIDQLALITAYSGSQEGSTFILNSVDSTVYDLEDDSMISSTYRDYRDKGKIKTSADFPLFLQRLEQAKMDILNHRIPGV